MEYGRFVALRRPASEAFAEDLEQARRSPRSLDFDELEGLTFRYRQLLHDHALARARFPGTSFSRQLERLVLEGTLWLQRDTGSHLPSLRGFFFESFPRAMGRLWPTLGLTASFFVLSALLGAVLTAADPTLASHFLHPEAIAGLRSGELWTESIFAVTPGAVASSAIATNNLSVALTGWAGGMAAGVLAIYLVFVNGLMLGSAFTVTARYSMAGSLFEFVAAHGPLEISLILITSAAGLQVGKALVQAGDVPRATALQAAGRDALVVLLGCLPWILLLGFVEGFLSPSTELSLASKLALGLTLEALFLAIAWGATRDRSAARIPVVGEEAR